MIYTKNMMHYDAIKKQIIEDLLPLKPKKIIIFGSFANGTFREGASDIDLIVVNDDTRRLAERYKHVRLSLTSPYPFDIFVLTEEELRKKQRISFFFNEILSQGKTIYER